MNIDLLISKEKEPGLVATGRFESQVTAAIFDHETLTISLEFAQTMDSMTLNVPVDYEFVPFLRNTMRIYLIATDTHSIHEARRVPLHHVNDENITPATGEWR